MVYKEEYIILDNSLEVFYRCWIPSTTKGLVIGVHGFAEHSGRYSILGKSLESARYGFCIHDLRGHGLTAKNDRERGYIEKFDDFLTDLELFIKKIIESYNIDTIALLGHSMGGLIVLHYIARIKKYVRTAITSGAATILNISALARAILTLLNAIYPRCRFRLPIDARALSHDETVVRAYISDPLVVKNPTIRLIYELVKASDSIWRYIDQIDIPILLIHGSEDRIVPPEASKKVFESLKVREKDIKIYEGMYHEVLQELNKEIVINDIINWLNRYLKQS